MTSGIDIDIAMMTHYLNCDINMMQQRVLLPEKDDEIAWENIVTPAPVTLTPRPATTGVPALTPLPAPVSTPAPAPVPVALSPASRQVAFFQSLNRNYFGQNLRFDLRPTEYGVQRAVDGALILPDNVMFMSLSMWLPAT